MGRQGEGDYLQTLKNVAEVAEKAPAPLETAYKSWGNAPLGQIFSSFSPRGKRFISAAAAATFCESSSSSFVVKGPGIQSKIRGNFILKGKIGIGTTLYKG